MKYYHLSEVYLGKYPTFKPKIPASAVHYYENITIPRVCFCPTIVQCLYAINAHDLIDNYGDIDIEKLGEAFFYEPDNFAIYTTTETLTPAGRVADKKITGEMWSRKSIQVKFEGYLRLSTFIMTGKIKTTNRHVRSDKEMNKCMGY